MLRRTFDSIVSSVGALLTVFLLIAGALLFWGYSFANDNVTKELSAQQITFPEADDPQMEDPRIGPFIAQYAGETLTTGEQAEAYANHFIAVHIADRAGTDTYATLGPKVRANPDDAELAALRETVFKGETLRGLLLNAYAFWKLGQIAKLGAFAAFGLAGVMGMLTIMGFWHVRRAAPEATIFAPATRHREAV